jgi:hypothetical protein
MRKSNKLYPHLCQHCGKTFYNLHKHAKYCNRTCHGKAQTLQNQVTVRCYSCGQSITRARSRMRGQKMHFCSHKCQQKRGYPDFAERFWALIDRRGVDECWPWLGATNNHGHGTFLIKRGQTRPAQVVAWELTYGPFPKGKQGNHTCDISSCCNPHHVYPGTQAENGEDTIYAQRHSGRPSTLTLQDIAEIQKLLGTVKQKDIATLYHVSPGTISSIKHDNLRRAYPSPEEKPDRIARLKGMQLFLPVTKFVNFNPI